jgi:hypothetical protein
MIPLIMASVQLLLKASSWRVSVSIQTKRRIDQRCPHSDYRIIRCYYLHFFFSATRPTLLKMDHRFIPRCLGLCTNSSDDCIDASYIGIIGSSGGVLSFSFLYFFLPLKNRHLACGILASLGSRNVYKDMLNNMVSPIDHVVMNHQNKTRTNGLWGHVRYNLPLFGDLWQNKQSKHKFAKIDKIRTTYTCLDAYHHPNSPRSNFPLFWSSLSMFTHSLPLPTMEPLACFGPTFAPFGIKSPKSPKQKGSKETSKS